MIIKRREFLTGAGVVVVSANVRLEGSVFFDKPNADKEITASARLIMSEPVKVIME